MRRAAALAALLVVLARPAGAQIKIAPGDGGGVSGGAATSFPLQPGSTFTILYVFESINTLGLAAGGSGWRETNSQAVSPAVTPEAYSPGVYFDAQSNDQWARVWEQGLQTSPLSQKKNGAESLQFNVTMQEGASGRAATPQVCVGDTAFIKFQKRPDGFGVLYGSSGASTSLPSNFKIDQWIAYVGNGTDTTYTPIGAAAVFPAVDNFYISAAANGGAVSFWHNGTLAATIADVTRSNTVDNRGVSIMTTGDDVGFDLFLGPLSVTRSW